MGKKNCKKPKKVIDLTSGGMGRYAIYCLGSGGVYSRNGAPKCPGDLLPFIERGIYDGITLRAKKSILNYSTSNNKSSRLVKRLEEVEL